MPRCRPCSSTWPRCGPSSSSVETPSKSPSTPWLVALGLHQHTCAASTTHTTCLRCKAPGACADSRPTQVRRLDHVQQALWRLQVQQAQQDSTSQAATDRAQLEGQLAGLAESQGRLAAECQSLSDELQATRQQAAGASQLQEQVRQPGLWSQPVSWSQG